MNIDELKEAMLENKDIEAFVNTMISNKVDEEVSGLKTKNTELLGEKKDLLTKLEGAPTPDELDEFKKLKSNIESSKYAKMIADGQIDDVVNEKVERIISDHNTKNAEYKVVIDRLRDENAGLKTEHIDYLLEDAIKKAAVKGGVVGDAIDDVARRAAGIFSIDSDGSIVARDSDGFLITTTDEKTLTPETFIADLKENASHFWPQSVSANLVGSVTDNDLAKSAASGDIDSYLSRRRKQIKESNERG